MKRKITAAVLPTQVMKTALLRQSGRCTRTVRKPPHREKTDRRSCPRNLIRTSALQNMLKFWKRSEEKCGNHFSDYYLLGGMMFYNENRSSLFGKFF